MHNLLEVHDCLRNVLNDCDEEFYVGQVINPIQPSDDVSATQNQCHSSKEQHGT
jgi:hypothetical protein